eukprot:1136326-Pelagomonas_calceolata.AAC.2
MALAEASGARATGAHEAAAVYHNVGGHCAGRTRVGHAGSQATVVDVLCLQQSNEEPGFPGLKNAPSCTRTHCSRGRPALEARHSDTRALLLLASGWAALEALQAGILCLFLSYEPLSPGSMCKCPNSLFHVPFNARIVACLVLH